MQRLHDQTVIFYCSISHTRKLGFLFVTILRASETSKRLVQLQWARTLPLARVRLGPAGVGWLPIFAVALALVGCTMAACSTSAQEALSWERATRLETAADRLYDVVQNSDWTAAVEQLQKISGAARPTLTRFDDAGAALTKALIRSARAVRKHDRAGALHSANKIIEWTAIERGVARPEFPPQVARLGYLAREIQIENEENNAEKLAARIVEARQCWDKLEPLLKAQDETALVTEGDDVIRRLEAGGNPKALTEAQGSFIKVVGEMEDVFERCKR